MLCCVVSLRICGKMNLKLLRLADCCAHLRFITVCFTCVSVIEHSTASQTVPTEPLESHFHQETDGGEEDGARFPPSVVP